MPQLQFARRVLPIKALPSVHRTRAVLKLCPFRASLSHARTLLSQSGFLPLRGSAAPPTPQLEWQGAESCPIGEPTPYHSPPFGLGTAKRWRWVALRPVQWKVAVRRAVWLAAGQAWEAAEVHWQ